MVQLKMIEVPRASTSVVSGIIFLNAALKKIQIRTWVCPVFWGFEGSRTPLLDREIVKNGEIWGGEIARNAKEIPRNRCIVFCLLECARKCVRGSRHCMRESHEVREPSTRKLGAASSKQPIYFFPGSPR